MLFLLILYHSTAQSRIELTLVLNFVKLSVVGLLARLEKGLSAVLSQAEAFVS